MRQITDIVTTPEIAASNEKLKSFLASQLKLKSPEINFVKVLRRSVDARSRNIKINLKVEVFINEEYKEEVHVFFHYQKADFKKTILIVGAGPAGLFAALRCIELGLRPIVLERGKNVQDRRRDLAAINKEHIVNPESNYCFGEGGAGTYSDGKLYTRSTKRGDVEKILKVLVQHGASEEILVEAHPHIGTNKLPKIIVSMRETIIRCGGEVHFNTRVVDLIVKDKTVRGVVVKAGDEISEINGDAVILATGHSARDIFELLESKQILIEPKTFAMGVRIEHPQEIIDGIQYHCHSGEEVKQKRDFLPAASYSLVEQVEGRGVYSFCMCPGGIIAPCATGPEEVVTNGWSPSKRNNPFANSGIVTTVEPEDYKHLSKHGVLSALRYQQEVEKLCWVAGGKTQTAPAQRMVDFSKGKISATLPECSYQPGIKSVPLHEVLPKPIALRLRKGFELFGKKMRGYFTNDAVLVAPESRTSSPIRIPRDKESLQHLQIKGLYPCGEGAGYAGGIVSAAIDGEKCAEACGN